MFVFMKASVLTELTVQVSCAALTTTHFPNSLIMSSVETVLHNQIEKHGQREMPETLTREHTHIHIHMMWAAISGRYNDHFSCQTPITVTFCIKGIKTA